MFGIQIIFLLYPRCIVAVRRSPCRSMTLRIARVAASPAFVAPVAMMDANSSLISSCSRFFASPRGSEDSDAITLT